MFIRDAAEKYIVDKLNEIREEMSPYFKELGHLNICIDYNYISAFSNSHCDGKERQVYVTMLYNADGTERYKI